jgi:hypothetical protein
MENNPHKAQAGVQCKTHPRRAWVHKTHTFTGKQRLRTNSFHHWFCYKNEFGPCCFHLFTSPPVAHFIPNLNWIGVLMPTYRHFSDNFNI